VYDRGNSGVPEERECMSEKNGGRIRTRREKTGIGPKERQEGAGCATKRERDDGAYVEWMPRQYFLRFHLENRQLLNYAACFLEMLFSTAAL
jgi:hypothetical protein